MKKGSMKKIAAFLLGLSLLIPACSSSSGGNAPTPEPDPKPEPAKEEYEVAIKNKEYLQTEWPANDGARKVEIELTPKGNLAVLINNGSVTIESSDTEVLTIAGQMATPVAPGDATITVKSGKYSDSVDVVISEAVTNKEKYGIDHEGDEADPLTNEDALTVAKHEDYDGAAMYVRGEVLSFYHAPGSREDGAVSWFLKPATEGGEKFEIYKCYGEGAKPLTDQDIWVGAIATAYGPFTSYNGQYETSGAVLTKVEGEPPAPRTTIEATFDEALAAGLALPDGGDSYDYYQFDAYVTGKVGKNYFLTAEKGASYDKNNSIELYNVSGDELVGKLMKDALITVTMILKNYHGQVENLLTLTTDDVVVKEEGGEWVDPVAIEVSVAEALAIESPGSNLYKITGILKEITTPYSSQYGNITFTLKDTTDGSKVMTIYRLNCTAEESAKLVPNATVVVEGYITSYQGANQLAAGGKFISAEGGDVPPEPEYIDVTVAEALEVINALDDGGITTDIYRVSGVVVAAEAYSEQYKNVTFTMGDTVEDAAVLTVFRWSTTAEEAAKLVAGAEVEVVATLQKYVKNEQVIPETKAITSVTIGGDVPPEPEYIDVTVAEALEVINALDDGGITTDIYRVSGVVVAAEAYSEQYKNVTFTMGDTVEDAAVLTVFRWSTTAEEAAKLVAGAEVEVVATLQKYVKNEQVIPETKAITSVTIGGDVPPEPEVVEVSVAEALAVENPGDTIYQITGIIKSIKTPYSADYGNISLIVKDEADESKEITFFRLSCTAEEAALMLVNAKIVAKGKITVYQEVNQLAAGAELVSVEGGDVPPEPGIIEATVAEALAAIDALEDGGITTDVYKVSGVVVSAEEYSSQYGNVTFTMGDTVEDTAVLTVFRWKTTAEEAAKLEVGAEVEVTATLQKYVKDGVATPETKAITSVIINGEVPPEPEALSVSLAAGNNSSAAKVNDKDAIKVGTSKADGDMKVVLGKDVKTLKLHIAAWKDKPGTIRVTAPAGVTVSETELTLTADAGISNNPPFTLAGEEATFEFTLELSGLTETTELILASGSARRFVVWGATVA